MATVIGNRFGWPDYLAVGGCLVGSAAIGLFYAYRGHKKTTVDSYLLGERNMNVVAVGISLIVTFFTAIMYTGVPAEGYLLGAGFAYYAAGIMVSCLFVAFVFVPVLYPLKLTTTYEYLYRRFDSKSLRIMAASCGILNSLLLSALTTFASAVAIASVSDIPVLASISVMTVLATLYTSLGGLKAVVWTDVFQYVIMLIGVLSVLIMGTAKVGGVYEVIRLCTLGGRMNHPTFNPDPRLYYSFWSMLIGSSMTTLSSVGVQQMTVQRFNSVSNLSSARWSILVGSPGFLIFSWGSTLMGLIVYAYNRSIACDPLANGDIVNINQIIPYFVSTVLSEIPGMAGIFIAAICCSTLSTVSSALNSLSALIWEDILRFRFGHLQEKRITVMLKTIVCVFGGIMVLLSFLVSMLQSTLARIGIAVFGATGGPVFGTFVLGMAMPQANWIGAAVGLMVSMATCSFVAVGGIFLPPAPSLPLAPVSGCTLTNISTAAFNLTSALVTFTPGNLTFVSGYPRIPDRVDIMGPMSVFRLSPTYYSVLGTSMSILVGALVSLLTGPTNPSAVAPELLFSAPCRFFSRLRNSSGKEIEKKEECNDTFITTWIETRV